jgi:hypothetical protein
MKNFVKYLVNRIYSELLMKDFLSFINSTIQFDRQTMYIFSWGYSYSNYFEVS